MVQIVEPDVKLLWATDDAMKHIAYAGKTSRYSWALGISDQNNKAHSVFTPRNLTEADIDNFVTSLIKAGHESVLEHAVASFWIRTDRGVTHELVRHRLASYTQMSTRYIDNSELIVIRPYEIPIGEFLPLMQIIENHYRNHLSIKNYSKDAARSILPNALCTEIVMTANFREWRHILKLRCSPHAHPQMREIMIMIRRILVKDYPVIFKGTMIDDKCQ